MMMRQIVTIALRAATRAPPAQWKRMKETVGEDTGTNLASSSCMGLSRIELIVRTKHDSHCPHKPDRSGARGDRGPGIEPGTAAGHDQESRYGQGRQSEAGIHSRESWPSDW